MATATARRGAFILFEGVDRCGKTTQARKLVDALTASGVPARFMRFPDRETSIGKLLDAYLSKDSDIDDHGVHLLFSANRWEAAAAMEAALAEGTTLIVDRYAHSGVAFSSAKPGMEVAWCKQPDVGLPAPDVVFFLDLPVDRAEARGGFGEERYELAPFQRAVRENFRLLEDDTWQIINADKDIEPLHEELKGKALAVVETAATTPVGKLWV